MADRLAALGASVTAADPYVSTAGGPTPPCTLVPFGAEALADADLTVLLVDHPEFDAATICEHAPLVFDTKGVLRASSFTGEVL